MSDFQTMCFCHHYLLSFGMPRDETTLPPSATSHIVQHVPLPNSLFKDMMEEKNRSLFSIDYLLSFGMPRDETITWLINAHAQNIIFQLILRFLKIA